MVRPNRALIVKALVLMSIISSVLTICGVAWNIYSFTLIGLIAIVLNVVLSVNFADSLGTALLTLVVTLIPMALSFSYELLSGYPLGADVHSEYFVIRKMQSYTQLEEVQKELQVLFGIPGYYTETLNLILSSNVVVSILGIDLLYVIKFLWNSLILGLIPLITFICSHRLMEDKKSAVVASVLIFSQSTYIITLHSTVKHVTSLFLTNIAIFLTLRTLKWNEIRKELPTLIILVTGLTGYHYLTSGVSAMVFFMGLALLYLVALLKSKSFRSPPESLKTASYIALSLILIWTTWYFITFQSIVKPVADLIIRLFTLRKAEYYYEKINAPLPVFINVIRLGVNGIIVLGVLVSGILAFINTKKSSIIDSIIAVSSALFLLGALSELLGISTLGIGRVSLTLLIFAAPYFCNAVSLIVHKLFGILKKHAAITLLLVSLILATRLLISVGVASYIFSDVENSIYVDPNYRYRVSLTYADLQAANFIINKIFMSKIYVGSDYRSRTCFIYVCTEKCYASISLVNYFASLSGEKILLHSTYLLFLSSYNVIERAVQISVTEFKDLSEYLPYIKSANSLIYGNGLAYIFRLRGS
jgi:hypothetical protein